MTIAGQLTLSFDPTITDRFESFHRDNPKVYETLVRLAREWINRTGRRKLGIATLFERARWELSLATSDPEFKLNNTYRAYYARLLMAQEPDLAGLFDCRASEADDWIFRRGTMDCSHATLTEIVRQGTEALCAPESEADYSGSFTDMGEPA